MPSLNILIILLAVGLLACLIGLSLAALGLLLPALLPSRLQTAREYLRPPALWMGLGHGVLLLFLVSRIGHRPLIGMVALIWLLFALVCVALGLAAWVQHVGFLLWPDQPKVKRTMGSALVLAWACAFPYLGQILGIGLLLAAYGAGLAGWTKGRPKEVADAPPASPSPAEV